MSHNRNQFNTTAVVPTAHREQRANRTNSINTYVIEPSREIAAYMAAVGLGVAIALVSYTFSLEGVLWCAGGYLVALPLSFGGIGGGLMAMSRLNSYEPAVLNIETTYQTPQRTPPQSTGVEPARITAPMGTAVVEQSRAGAVRTLVNTVLDPNNRQSFSTRACNAHGVNYDHLIAEFRRVGVLHSTTTNNGSPAMTDVGRAALTAYSKGLPYPA
ncbi:MAG: hypothetical protein GY938_16720 [Ketobacter sp.]|nr:hypothetical protein [Ketobacter sp.]